MTETFMSACFPMVVLHISLVYMFTTLKLEAVSAEIL